MQLHNIKSNTKRKSKKRVGRGGKRGTYSGKGMKGQKSRAGRKLRPEMRDTIKKLPKKRGYKFQSFREKQRIVNIGVLDEKFKDGDKIAPKSLLEAGVIRRVSGRMPKVKLLGEGNLTKKLLVSECQISKSAREKIIKAGGQILENQRAKRL
ncbi:MAG: 50S ribosomal protein L15 [Candidatus Tagabacteria bacterium RIFCSPLOWO2_01_FULL_39_11]|uniref:Large ribosomal subunit protein uL15 n=1 Tax=Candidatus Tagabacteria bacterium RIFCSPLOWO2_01_FULL_39_11 TaxID=1802295 RepID=A0A1G2LRJ9_9BACT|nr:MAG: 50S ribosomal protein L15 [Candidatus Tagabacteria bacterium RIFCSPLOWO2_01_FULL_39_11]